MAEKLHERGLQERELEVEWVVRGGCMRGLVVRGERKGREETCSLFAITRGMFNSVESVEISRSAAASASELEDQNRSNLSLSWPTSSATSQAAISKIAFSREGCDRRKESGGNSGRNCVRNVRHVVTTSTAESITECFLRQPPMWKTA